MFAGSFVALLENARELACKTKTAYKNFFHIDCKGGIKFFVDAIKCRFFSIYLSLILLKILFMARKLTSHLYKNLLEKFSINIFLKYL